MSEIFFFDQVGRVPEPGDNAALSNRRLEAGSEIRTGDGSFQLPHTILEGHRFAVVPISTGEPLLSWGLSFGKALRAINPGDYICNAKILEALRQRHVDFSLPKTPNFEDRLVRYQFDETRFSPGRQVQRIAENRFFDGFARGKGRGVGTRNYIVVLGTTSWTSGFARSLADRFKDVPHRFPNIDGVVAIAHTEGGGSKRPNNFELVLRTLAGFLVNPNVCAALAVDLGSEPVTNVHLREYLRTHNYPIDDLPHQFLSVRGNYLSALAKGESILKSWLEDANKLQRSRQSVEHLKIGLQCGGSDAFSGVSGNPLVGWVSKELVRYGGAANLAETDELMGAEEYILKNVRDAATARKFLDTLERFRERVAWHGHTAEGNPSGGNNFRGLYNIAIKSIGAARKKDPEVRIDHVIEYAERMLEPGYYFMDSPGNDLESVAGQVGAACNLILFTTGNGSITNFPFVPTIKIMTSTGRYKMLSREMDVNAGRYMDGTPMEDLGRETFDLMLRVASGEKSAGEKAGQSQVQLWREWRQTNNRNLTRLQSSAPPTDEPIPLDVRSRHAALESKSYRAIHTGRGLVTDQLDLIVPTSLCAGQIARMISEKHNREVGPNGLRCVALAHTEGCGVSGGDSEQLYLRTMTSYLNHPLVHKALLLEHGCEKTHNDAMRNFLEEEHRDPARFGWASIQLDGGIESVTSKVLNWFASNDGVEPTFGTKEVGMESLRLGVTADGIVPDAIALALAELIRAVVKVGGTVVAPQYSSLFEAKEFAARLGLNSKPCPSLAYGQPFRKSGFHIMETPTDHHVETLTGLGATGVEVMIAHIGSRYLQGHPLVPLLQFGTTSSFDAALACEDLDLMLEPADATPDALAERILDLTLRVASRELRPKLFSHGNTDFQMTRGQFGVSL